MFKKNFFQVSSNSPYDLISQINLERVCHLLMKKSFKAVLSQENLNQGLFLKLYYWFRLWVFIKTIPWVLFHALNRRPGKLECRCLFCLFFLVMCSLILQPLTLMILKKIGRQIWSTHDKSQQTHFRSSLSQPSFLFFRWRSQGAKAG